MKLRLRELEKLVEAKGEQKADNRKRGGGAVGRRAGEKSRASSMSTSRGMRHSVSSTASASIKSLDSCIASPTPPFTETMRRFFTDAPNHADHTHAAISPGQLDQDLGGCDYATALAMEDFQWPTNVLEDFGSVPGHTLNMAESPERLSPGQDCIHRPTLAAPLFPHDLTKFEFPLTNGYKSSGRICQDKGSTLAPQQADAAGEAPCLNVVDKDASLCDRLNNLRDHAARLGFNSLDAAISSYYTADLRESPALFNEQCLSRNRRLPSLLSDIIENSKTWNRWERVGYVKEALRSAEEILVDDFNMARGELDTELSDLTEKELTMDLIPKVMGALHNKVRLQSQTPISSPFHPTSTIGCGPWLKMGRQRFHVAMILTRYRNSCPISGPLSPASRVTRQHPANSNIHMPFSTS